MYQTEALPHGFSASILGIKRRLFAERIVEQSLETVELYYIPNIILMKCDHTFSILFALTRLFMQKM